MEHIMAKYICAGCNEEIKMQEGEFGVQAAFGDLSERGDLGDSHIRRQDRRISPVWLHEPESYCLHEHKAQYPLPQ